MVNYSHRGKVSFLLSKQKNRLYPVLKCDKETKGALLEMWFYGFVRTCQEFNKGLLIDQRMEHLAQQIKNNLTPEAIADRLYFAIYKAQIPFERKKDSGTRLFFSRAKFNNPPDIKAGVKFKPVIENLADRQFIKNTYLRMLQFIHQMRTVPLIDGTLFLDWKFPNKSRHRNQIGQLNPEDGEIAKEDDQ